MNEQLLESSFVIKVTTSILKGSNHVPPANEHFSLSAKMYGTLRTLVSPLIKNALCVLQYVTSQA